MPAGNILMGEPLLDRIENCIYDYKGFDRINWRSLFIVLKQTTQQDNNRYNFASSKLFALKLSLVQNWGTIVVRGFHRSISNHF